jgi:hypothetical protein
MRLRNILDPAPTSSAGARLAAIGLVCAALVASAASAAAVERSLAASPQTAQPPAAERLFIDLWREPDPKELHARLVAEQRDPVWAPRMEKLLAEAFANPNPAGGERRYLRITCKSTLCEVVTVVARRPITGSAAEVAASNAIIQDFYAVDRRMADRYFVKASIYCTAFTTDMAHRENIPMYACFNRR